MITRRQAMVLAASAPAIAMARPEPQHKVRGMTISCPTDGYEWGTDQMAPTIQRLKGQGYNWITTHPYAGIRKSGEVYEWGRLQFDSPPPYITRPIEEAHDRGLKMLMKPHLGYWGSGFSWRGVIAFDSEAKWKRFFADYTRWIVKVARASKGADGFVVGTELDKTLHREGDWRKVINEIRQVYDGPLTLAPNWSDYKRVPFWDALDVIGLQAYMPLVKGGQPPTRANLDAGWRQWMAEFATVSERHRKPIVFTELGYNNYSGAAEQPWNYNSGGPDAEGVQSRALGAALEAIGHSPHVVGAFLWKCFPGRSKANDFDMEAPHIKQVVKRYWG